MIICLYFACIVRLVVLPAKNTSKIQAYEQIWHTYKHIQTQHMTWIQADIAVCICLYMLICVHICWYLLVLNEKIIFSKKWHIGTYNSACICLYDVYMSYVSVFSMSFYVLACMYLYLYVCVYIHLYGHVSACITCNTQVMYTIILGIFSVTNIILEVILVHICIYSFILTCIGAYVLVYECINKYVVYIYVCICMYVSVSLLHAIITPI